MDKFGRETREYMAGHLKQAFGGSQNILVTGFTNLSVPDLQELRTSLSGASSRYLVVKNTIARRVMEELKLEDIKDLVTGTCGVVILGEDPIAATKVLTDFKKVHKTLDIRGGILDGDVVSPEKIKELSALPPREVLLGMVVAGIYSPVTGFVNTLAGVIRKFVYALNAIKEKGGKQDDGRKEGN